MPKLKSTARLEALIRDFEGRPLRCRLTKRQAIDFELPFDERRAFVFRWTPGELDLRGLNSSTRSSQAGWMSPRSSTSCLARQGALPPLGPLSSRFALAS
jgi:hypothetical protein